MKHSLVIAKPFGIKVGIHWTFLFLILFIVGIDVYDGLNLQQVLMSVLFLLTLFVCVILHELGHSVVAQSMGGEVKSITLLPIGGMANISKMPDRPKQEFLITIAGPAVNVIIAVSLALILAFSDSLYLSQLEMRTITWSNFLFMLMAANIFIVFFNLIPAFPMDGGRILRSALSLRMGRVKATQISQYVGQAFAVAFVILGFYFNPFLVLIGAFVFIGARAEFQMALSQDSLKDSVVSDVITKNYQVLKAESNLREISDLIVRNPEPGYVVFYGEDYLGIVEKSEIIKGIAKNGPEIKVMSIVTDSPGPVNAGDALHAVHQECLKNRWSLVPVFENGKIAGVVYLDNIKQLIQLKRAQTRAG